MTEFTSPPKMVQIAPCGRCGLLVPADGMVQHDCKQIQIDQLKLQVKMLSADLAEIRGYLQVRGMPCP